MRKLYVMGEFSRSTELFGELLRRHNGTVASRPVVLSSLGRDPWGFDQVCIRSVRFATQIPYGLAMP